jgi:hypothetical protein
MPWVVSKAVWGAIPWLACGFIVNVAVAWSCSLIVDLTSAKVDSGRTVSDQIWWIVSRKHKWGSASFSSSASSLPETYDYSQITHVPRTAESLLPSFADLNHHQWQSRRHDQHSAREILACGWPCLALWCETRPEGQNNQRVDFKVRSGIVVSLPHRNWGCRAHPRVLPLNVAWPGFAANTIFYAGISWLLVAAPFASRRAIRRRHNRCLRCNYDLRGHHGSNARCPECGTDIGG